jgi:uncharacterized protein involved in exopolysaccharide biosynthesis
MTESESPQHHPQPVADEELSVLDLLIVLAKYKLLVLGLPFVVALLAIGYALTLPNVYTASAKILPPKQSQSASSALLAQVGSLANLVGGAGGISGPNDLYIAMMKSRTVADNLIRRFGLMELYEINAKYPSDAYIALEKVTKFTLAKDSSVISIEVDDKDPKRAADLANAYVEELLKFTQVLAVTEASQRRLFFERQFAQAKDNLFKAEAAARQALQSGGLVKVDDQGRAMVEATARLRGQITVKEVQIGAMRAFAADRNPDLQLALQELESMKRELAKSEGAGSAKLDSSGQNSQGANSLRLLRDVKYHEVIFDLLARQYEMAKIDEAKDAAVIQIMDKAIVPDRKSKPKRAQMVILWTMVAGLLAAMLAFGRESLSKGKGDPRTAQRLQSIKRYLAWR